MRKEDFFDAASSSKKRIDIGDKVRFLNSLGGGKVTAFHGKDQVLVEDENGFDIPVLISECVVIGGLDKRLENKEPEQYVPSVKQTPVKEKTKQIEIKNTFTEKPEGERINACLAFLPVDAKAFMQTSFESYFINESNYYLYVNYLSCTNNSWTSRYHGLIEPDTKIFIEEFEKASLSEFEHICVQMLAFKEGKSFALKNPMSVEMRLDTVKFYKLHCFTKNEFFDEDALIVPLVTDDKAEKQMLVSASEMQEAMYSRKDEIRRKPHPAAKPSKTEKKVLEVDLHINQLLDTTAGMSNSDMLNYQLNKFNDVMKANAGKKGQKIVFIHGKGEGVLRSAIEKELKTTYKQKCCFQDASFREYGFGATMVTIF